MQQPFRVLNEWDERAFYVQADNTASQDADRPILTLSSGALAISLVFVHDIAPKHPHAIPWLATAWSLFALGILLTLLSYKVGQTALRAEIKRIDTRANRQNPTGWDHATTALNWLSGLSLILGVAALLVFAVLNVQLS